MGDGQNDETVEFLTLDKRVIDRASLHKEDVKVMTSAATGEGLIEVTPELLEQLAEAARLAWEAAGEDAARFVKTKDDARYVRRLRVDDGLSWRQVADACHARWKAAGAGWSPASNQIWGMAFCQRAADVLGEDAQAEPWN